jgi:hypothetical protein
MQQHIRIPSVCLIKYDLNLLIPLNFNQLYMFYFVLVTKKEIGWSNLESDVEYAV